MTLAPSFMACFLSRPLSNPSNSIGSTFKIELESSHCSPNLLVPFWFQAPSFLFWITAIASHSCILKTAQNNPLSFKSYNSVQNPAMVTHFTQSKRQSPLWPLRPYTIFFLPPSLETHFPLLLALLILCSSYTDWPGSSTKT